MACSLLGACSTASVVSSVLSSAVGSKPGVSAELQIGDDTLQTEDVTVGKKEEVVVTTTIEQKVETAKVVKADSSVKKVDKKTEIGEVTGSVSVNQGPTTGVLVALGLGWPLFFIYLIIRIWRLINAKRCA